MNNKADWVVVGVFGRPHGVKGLVSVHSYTEPSENILNYNNWFVETDGQWTPLKLLNTQVTAKAVLACIEGCNDRDEAAKLTNVKIAIQREQLGTLEPDEYYWHELIGMSVINKTDGILGCVEALMPTGANDVLVVIGEKRHLIPYLRDRVVLEVNQEKRVILVDWDPDY